ncbi:hypothetical protein EZV62_019604 [Acer yangbiense]|uniref:Tobamovirus multiplication protein 2A n=1 Tax=Acer yangbiense TaxID=1000413 RepID=A0A5C7HBX3_9ROSI|nr:hypothetical protein EZV62_019604 [Acer yangbiense]
MACRGCFECLLKLLNFLLTLAGLAMVGYGIYLFVEYKRAEANNTVMVLPATSDQGLVQLGRPMLMAVSLSANIFDNLPKPCRLMQHCYDDSDVIGSSTYLLVLELFSLSSHALAVLEPQRATGAACVVFMLIPCSKHYSVLVILLILVELGCAAVIFFDKTWKDEIPTDKTGYFNMIYDFLKENWSIVRWVALGVVILEPLSNKSAMELQALIFLLALMVRAANKPVEYDSDDEILAPRQQIRQPFLNRPPPPATGVPVAGTADQRPSRNDAWSTRMREKYGLDTSEFTYNPSESHRFQQVPTQQTEERSRCTIM